MDLDNNHYFLMAELKEKDVWKAIKKFRQEILQPYIGSMLYSGIKVKAEKNMLLFQKNMILLKNLLMNISIMTTFLSLCRKIELIIRMFLKDI